MRLVALFLLAGCPPSAADVEGPEPVCEVTWYLDADGDGYGDPNTTGVVACSPNLANGFTVENDDDCDDSDGSITWGMTCPAAFASNCIGTVTQFATGTTEYLIVGPSLADPSDASCVVLPTAVDALCGMWAPSATPIAIDNDGEFVSLKAHIPDSYNATWINAVPVDGAWAWADGGMAFSDLGPFCDNVSDVPTDPAATHLALIKRKLSANTDPVFCLGQPDHVWGRYFQEVVSGMDQDGDGLPDAVDPNPSVFDTDGDGMGDGWEVVMGTDPEVADDFPLLSPTPPTLAFDNAHAFLACERAN